MDFSELIPFINQIQLLRKRADDVALPPGACIPMIDSAKTPGNFLDLDGSAVSRLVYPELDAKVGLQSDMLSIERLTMPGGYAGAIYFIGNAWATADGGVIYWNGTALAKETVCGAEGVVVSYYSATYMRAAVVIVPDNGTTEAHYAFWRNTGSGWVEVTTTMSHPFSAIHMVYYTYAPANDFKNFGSYYVASEPSGFFYLLMETEDSDRKVFRWVASGDTVSYYGSAKDYDFFTSPALPYLQTSRTFAAPKANYEGLPEQILLQTYTEDNEAYTSSLIGPFAVHGSILGAFSSYGYAAPPWVATNQYSLIQSTGRPGTLLMKHLGYDVTKAYAYCYGSSFRFAAGSNSQFPTESTVWFIGGVWEDQVTYVNTPILMASFGLRNWHPITHSSFSDLHSFSNGFPVVDDNYSDFNTTLMEAMVAADASSVIYKIRANATCSITLPTEAASGGFKRVLWPGRKLPSTYTGAPLGNPY